MLDAIEVATTPVQNSGIHGGHNDGPEPTLGARTTMALAIEILQERGFVFIGKDPVGLPCYRSPSGALLIGVGSCRSLAYAMVGDRLQIIAAARTATLVCRIDASTAAVAADGVQRQSSTVPTAAVAADGVRRQCSTVPTAVLEGA